MTGQKGMQMRRRRMMRNEADGEFFDEESLLHDSKKDHGDGTDATFGGLSTAEGICIYQQLEQCFV